MIWKPIILAHAPENLSRIISACRMNFIEKPLILQAEISYLLCLTANFSAKRLASYPAIFALAHSLASLLTTSPENFFFSPDAREPGIGRDLRRSIPACLAASLRALARSATSCFVFSRWAISRTGWRFVSLCSPPIDSGTRWSACHLSPGMIFRPVKAQRPSWRSKMRSRTRLGIAASGDEPIHSSGVLPITFGPQLSRWLPFECKQLWLSWPLRASKLR